MNKFFKASLLAMVFVGMSSFSTVKSVEMTEMDEVIYSEPCENSADFAYCMAETYTPMTQAELTQFWSDVFWDCIDNGGGSNFTAYIEN